MSAFDLLPSSLGSHATVLVGVIFCSFGVGCDDDTSAPSARSSLAPSDGGSTAPGQDSSPNASPFARVLHLEGRAFWLRGPEQVPVHIGTQARGAQDRLEVEAGGFVILHLLGNGRVVRIEDVHDIRLADLWMSDAPPTEEDVSEQLLRLMDPAERKRAPSAAEVRERVAGWHARREVASTLQPQSPAVRQKAEGEPRASAKDEAPQPSKKSRGRTVPAAPAAKHERPAAPLLRSQRLGFAAEEEDAPAPPPPPAEPLADSLAAAAGPAPAASGGLGHAALTKESAAKTPQNPLRKVDVAAPALRARPQLALRLHSRQQVAACLTDAVVQAGLQRPLPTIFVELRDGRLTRLNLEGAMPVPSCLRGLLDEPFEQPNGRYEIRLARP